ncbi:efflux RND transporter periplasmic adaptor subunit [Arthrobacter sp. TMN-49]
MRVLRRVIFPIVWVLVFAVIAVALVKLAFIDGLKDDGEQPVPQAQVAAPVIAVNRATVTNTVEVAGTVQSDAATPVRSTAAGKVVFLFVEKGAQLAAGDRVFQVRSEVVPDPDTAVAPADDDESADTAQAPTAPVYAFTKVLAPVAGTLDTLSVLLNQEISVGDNTGSVSPGTFSITASLTTAQQFRLLGKPSSATGTITNGPAPFTCNNVHMSNKPADDDAPADAAAVPGAQEAAPPTDGSTGQVSCAVPAATTVFPGLGATITLTAGEAKDVLTLPLTAVKGSVQNGVVWVPTVDGSGEPEERKVVLGLNDGDKVEISSGLVDGDHVLEFVPGADAVVPAGQMAGFGQMGG